MGTGNEPPHRVARHLSFMESGHATLNRHSIMHSIRTQLATTDNSVIPQTKCTKTNRATVTVAQPRSGLPLPFGPSHFAFGVPSKGRVIRFRTSFYFLNNKSRARAQASSVTFSARTPESNKNVRRPTKAVVVQATRSRTPISPSPDLESRPAGQRVELRVADNMKYRILKLL